MKVLPFIKDITFIKKKKKVKSNALILESRAQLILGFVFVFLSKCQECDHTSYFSGSMTKCLHNVSCHFCASH